MDKTRTYLYEHEKRVQDKRRLIALALEKGCTYEQIQHDLGVGTSTISAVKKMMEGELRC